MGSDRAKHMFPALNIKKNYIKTWNLPKDYNKKIGYMYGLI